jgi:hypothetical protein
VASSTSILIAGAIAGAVADDPRPENLEPVKELPVVTRQPSRTCGTRCPFSG